MAQPSLVVINLSTLMMFASFIVAVSGVCLIFAWIRSRESSAMLWWAAADLTLAAGVPLMIVSGTHFGRPAQIVAMTLLNISPAMIWAAAQSHQRQPNRYIVIAGALLWLVAFTLPSFRASPESQTFFNLAIVSIYLFAAGGEFWDGRAERVRSSGPLVVLLYSQSFIFMISAVQAISGNLSVGGKESVSSWFGFILLEVLVFVVGTAIFVVAVDRETSDLNQRISKKMLLRGFRAANKRS
jgi:hypothetical protein